ARRQVHAALSCRKLNALDNESSCQRVACCKLRSRLANDIDVTFEDYRAESTERYNPGSQFDCILHRCGDFPDVSCSAAVNEFIRIDERIYVGSGDCLTIGCTELQTKKVAGRHV